MHTTKFGCQESMMIGELNFKINTGDFYNEVNFVISTSNGITQNYKAQHSAHRLDSLYHLPHVVWEISCNKLRSCPTSQDFYSYFILRGILHYLFLNNFAKGISAQKSSFLASLMSLTRSIIT